MSIKPALRKAFGHLSAATTIFLAGVAAVSQGWVIRGLILMGISVLYLIYELFTSKPITKNVPAMLRFIAALFAVVLFLGLNRDTIKGFFVRPIPAPSPTPSTPTPKLEPSPNASPSPHHHPPPFIAAPSIKVTNVRFGPFAANIRPTVTIYFVNDGTGTIPLESHGKTMVMRSKVKEPSAIEMRQAQDIAWNEFIAEGASQRERVSTDIPAKAERYITYSLPEDLSREALDALVKQTGEAIVFLFVQFTWKSGGYLYVYNSCTFNVGDPSNSMSCYSHNGPEAPRLIQPSTLIPNPDARLADDALQLAAKVKNLFDKYMAGLIASNAEHPGNALKDPHFRGMAWGLYTEYHNHYARDAVRLRDEMLNKLPSGSRDEFTRFAFGDDPVMAQAQQSPDFYLNEVSQYGVVARELERLGTALKKQSQGQ